MSNMTVNIKISGNVQGVFFRKSAKSEADKLGLFGWVRNNDDGIVEIQAGGDKKNLEKLIGWCKQGPPLARVEKVEVVWGDDDFEGEGFEILS